MPLSTQPTGPLRFRSRHLHATFYNHLKAELAARGWVTPPINFGARPITLIDYQPDERTQQIAHNTVAVSLGDYDADEDEELGAAIGGVRSAGYDVFVDVYMTDQSLSIAMCDEVRDIYTDKWLPLVNQINATQVPNVYIEIERVAGPDRPQLAASVENFKKYWRTMRVECRLFFST